MPSVDEGLGIWLGGVVLHWLGHQIPCFLVDGCEYVFEAVGHGEWSRHICVHYCAVFLWDLEVLNSGLDAPLVAGTCGTLVPILSVVWTFLGRHTISR